MEGLMILVRSGPEETGRVEEALRLAAAMLGFDEPPTIVFILDGVRCLHLEAFSDPTLQDYLQAVADLVGVHAVSSSRDFLDDLDSAFSPTLIDLNELATLMKDHAAVASY
jgi:sulfur relay (sulfurtransferase) DsrF/TusC family protein